MLGTAWGFSVGQVRNFVESLRRHYHGDAMLVISSRRSAPLIEYLNSFNIRPIYFDGPYWMPLHIQLARYIRYQEILRGVEKTYDRVLLTDVSDVLFQGDPFANLPEGELLCFMEAAGRTISQCQFNTHWIQQIYGEAGVERLKDCEISCSGITIGTHRAIVEYVDKLLCEATPQIASSLDKYRGHDQGIHNYLLRTGALPQARLIPNCQHVYTMGFVPDNEFSIGPAKTIIAPGGRVLPIVHQYDRKAAVLGRLWDQWQSKAAG